MLFKVKQAVIKSDAVKSIINLFINSILLDFAWMIIEAVSYKVADNGLGVYEVAIFCVTSVQPLFHCFTKDISLSLCNQAAIS